MLSGKDITIDKEGSIILNGDKHPLASQAEIEDVKDDVSALETVTDGLTNTIGDITQTGVTGDTVAAQIKNITKVKFKDVVLTLNSDGYQQPTQSGGGVYYERLANFTDLGVQLSDILSIVIVGWGSLSKTINPYLSSSGLSTMSESASSVYSSTDGEITVRILYI